MLKSYKVNSEGIPRESIMDRRRESERLDELEKRVNSRKLRRQLYPVKKVSRSIVRGIRKGTVSFVKSTSRNLSKMKKRMPSSAEVNRIIWR